MSTQRAPKSMNPKSSHVAIRISRLAIITAGLFSLYACDVADDYDAPFSEDAELSFEDAELSVDDDELSVDDDEVSFDDDEVSVDDDEADAEDDDLLAEQSSPPTESCDLALEVFPDDDLAYLSCSLDQPVNSSGFTTDDLASEASPDDEYEERACNTYYGTCSGANGCSRATGEGWEFTACGPFLYSWLTVCDGQASSWGTGFCLW